MNDSLKNNSAADVVVGVVDIGLGNVQAVMRSLRDQGVVSISVSGPGDLALCDGVVLPGVGSFDAGVTALHSSKLFFALQEYVYQDSKPLLGICLGMQLLGRESEEGDLDGLSVVPGRTIAMRSRRHELRIPHVPNMGWCHVNSVSDIWKVSGEKAAMDDRFYFVHSYYFDCDYAQDRLLVLREDEEIVAAVARDNIWGFQFHPEKSHIYGKNAIRRWIGSFVCP